MGLVFGLVTAFSIGLGGRPYFGRVFGLSDGLAIGLVVGLVMALSVGLGGGRGSSRWVGGLGEALKHYVTRVVLWSEVGLPLQLVSVLERGRSLLLLRREGGGYLFWHATLQAHFASLDESRLSGLTQRSLAEEAYQPKY